jgi:hypothetical protein
MDSEPVLRELRKIANLLALPSIEGLNKGDQARRLNAAGFSYPEIAVLTGMSESSIRAHVSQGKKRLPEKNDDKAGRPILVSRRSSGFNRTVESRRFAA